MKTPSPDLVDALAKLQQARQQVSRAEQLVWQHLLDAFPEIRDTLADWDIPVDQSASWFCAPRFDERTLSAADLFVAGRGNEVVRLLNQMAHGVYR
ncbi:MAG TPA: hypothetical protein P5171_03005 [Xanthomonadaceae bacterium]|nr:hypothetical protein [Xanthomonadaceae bacterium]HRX99072.1 hypothetical protein [Xanthomonadaceae bacterium]